MSVAILCCSSACSQQSVQPKNETKSRFTQEGLDRLSKACGLPAGTVLLDGVSSVRFGTAVTSDYKNLNCIQMKIRETYYPGAKTNPVASEPHEQEGDNAQAH